MSSSNADDRRPVGVSIAEHDAAHSTTQSWGGARRCKVAPFAQSAIQTRAAERSGPRETQRQGEWAMETIGTWY
jgi:hypothetical protein